MANPRDNTSPAPQGGQPAPNPALQAEYALGRELYINERTGRTHMRMPAGGTGGGVTSYADAPASEEMHVAFLKSEAERKQAEGENLQQQHDDAHAELQDKKAEGDKKADINNPITDETYGRPPQHVPGLANQTGPRNPADERDYIDNQPVSERPAQNDPNQPRTSDKQPTPVA
jgi:hypothetical protein